MLIYIGSTLSYYQKIQRYWTIRKANESRIQASEISKESSWLYTKGQKEKDRHLQMSTSTSTEIHV